MDLPESQAGEVYIFDMQGHLMYQELTSGQERLEIDITGLPSGSYNVEFVPKDNTERLVYSRLVSKI